MVINKLNLPIVLKVTTSSTRGTMLVGVERLIVAQTTMLFGVESLSPDSTTLFMNPATGSLIFLSFPVASLALLSFEERLGFG